MAAKRMKLEASLLDLPNELLICILEKLKSKDLLTASCINLRIRSLVFQTNILNDKLCLVFKGNNWSLTAKMEVFKKMQENGRKFNQIKILNVVSTADFIRIGFKNILNILKKFFKSPDSVSVLILNDCSNVEWMDMVNFFKIFSRLETVEMRNNSFWNETMSTAATRAWRRMYSTFNNEMFPLTSAVAPAFAHLKTLRILSASDSGYQNSSLFQNAVLLETLDSNYSNSHFITRYNRLKNLKLIINQLSANFFGDEIQNLIKFRLNSFTLNSSCPTSITHTERNFSLFLERQLEIVDLELSVPDITDNVLKQVVKLPKLKKLEVTRSQNVNIGIRNYLEEVDERIVFRFIWEGVEEDDLDRNPLQDEDEMPQLPFEEVFSDLKNLSTDELTLRWMHDESALKFINLFPNCKKIDLTLSSANTTPFEIKFPHHQNLEEVSCSMTVPRDYDFNNIKIGKKLLEVRLDCRKPIFRTPESILKVIKNNPNIQSMTFKEGITNETLQVITSNLKNLKSLAILFDNGMNQNDVNLICDCQSLEDVDFNYVPKKFQQQIVKRFHTDVGRSNNDISLIDLPIDDICNIKILKNAAFLDCYI